MRRTLAIGLTLLALTAGNANAVVYYSKEEAFQLAFGEGATVETKPLFLSDAQTAQIEQLAQAKLESQLYTFYVGKRGEQVLGYAAIETHTVRSTRKRCCWYCPRPANWKKSKCWPSTNRRSTSRRNAGTTCC
ncbi:hypothetical protein [Methylogaea oryzae]|uniref:hypothetical protein n=1 Tax=Methylogaea oryzae TaxID=1295382 RepID=UPI0020D1B456|nr:hypothetical protein [Methylogaea oryzae]